MTAASPDNLYLSPDQQDLLLAALTSNSSSSPMFNTPPLSQHISHAISQKSRHSPHQSYDRSSSIQEIPTPQSAMRDSFQSTPLGEFGEWDMEGDSWDYDFPGGEMMHESTRSNSNDGTETINGERRRSDGNEKRKDPPIDDKSVDPHDSEPKRRDDKQTTAKKPGRKPLTSEPTSKRKAQNRAAQRAFRERKEKHLKDLEEKVEVLEKASESANHENSVLRAEVDRLQTELREYRRRLQTAELTRASSLGSGSHPGFQFDFPPFGSDLFGRNNGIGKEKEGQKNGATDNKRSPSIGSSKNGSSKFSQSPPMNEPIPSDLFSRSILQRVNKGGSPDHMSGFGQNSMGGTPGLSGHDSTSSPSASSVSQHGPGSSCGTSPEPMSNSPTISKPHDPLKPISEENTTVTTSPNGDTYVCKSGSLDGETETTFCEKLGMACGNPRNPVPKVPQFSTASETTANSLDWLAQQASGSTFDPVFSDYRDPVNDIQSSINNVNMSFFDEAFTMPAFDDIGSPLGGAPPEKKDLMAEIDAINNKEEEEEEEEEEEVVPADDDPKQMLSCNKIWSVPLVLHYHDEVDDRYASYVSQIGLIVSRSRDRISSHPRFFSGELDMDGLCSELRSKAKCSEVGVVVAENDVQEVLGKVGLSRKDVM